MSRVRQSGDGLSVRVGTLCFGVVVLAFLGLRFSAALTAPVAGPELVHLSGAWQASIGVSDNRYVPTLAQAVAALTFLFTASELPARLIGVGLSLAVPIALWILRPRLGDGTALAALLLLAIDPIIILFGGTATAFAFDVPAIALVGCVLAMPRLRARRAVWAATGLVLAVSGALVVPFVAAAVALAPRKLLTASRLPSWGRDRGAFLAGGALAGVVLTSLAFSGGWDGPRIAPLRAFAASYSGDLGSAPARELIVMYELPLFLAGIGASAWLVVAGRGRRVLAIDRFLLTWFAFSLAWVLSSLGTGGPASLAAAVVPGALLTGRAVPAAAAAAWRADWQLPRVAIPTAFALAGLALFPALQWADRGRPGDSAEVARVILLSIAAAGVLAALAVNRRTAPALAPVAAAILLVLIAAGAGGVAFGKSTEPLLSPYSPQQARDLRDFALAVRERDGGPIAIHTSLRDQFTWAFRDSGTIMLSPDVPEGASLVIWPYERQAPTGFVPVDGEWAFTRSLRSPAADALTLLHWLTDRATLASRVDRLAVYTRSGE